MIIKDHPHRRFNPLRQEWVLVSPDRTERPWQGHVEPAAVDVPVVFDPACYLCPGNERANGARNPRYTSTFVFDNDFAALVPWTPHEDVDAAEPGHEVLSNGELLVARAERGICRVVCFSPRHDLTLARMDVSAIRAVVDAWIEEQTSLAATAWIQYVQIFENRGPMMGASNPHPHGQIWATETVPNDPAREQASFAAHRGRNGRCLLCEYSALESRLNERVVCENPGFTAVVPFWAAWPFETLLVSRRHLGSIDELDEEERTALADIVRRLTIRYDNLFEAPFPYSMGFHQRPARGSGRELWHFHAHFYPPLLRSASIQVHGRLRAARIAAARSDAGGRRGAAARGERSALHGPIAGGARWAAGRRGQWDAGACAGDMIDMRIVDGKVIICSPDRNFVTLKLVTEDGVHGLGDATLNGRELAVASYLNDHVLPLLIGRDARRIEDTWQYLYKGAYWRRGPVTMTSIAAVDTALWDIRGKTLNAPVYELLGGPSRDSVLVYGHANGASEDEAVQSVARYMELGYRAVRAQSAIPGVAHAYGVGRGDLYYEPAEKGRPLEAVWSTERYLDFVPSLFDRLRREVGFEVHLLHDVHHRLTPIEAARLGKSLEPYRLFWLEDPVPAEVQDAYRVIRQHTTTPIAVGEVFNTIYDCQQLIEEHLIDYIRTTVVHAGGITHLRKIAALAELHHVRTGSHGATDLSPVCMAAALHFDLSVHNFGIQ